MSGDSTSLSPGFGSNIFDSDIWGIPQEGITVWKANAMPRKQLIAQLVVFDQSLSEFIDCLSKLEKHGVEALKDKAYMKRMSQLQSSYRKASELIEQKNRKMKIVGAGFLILIMIAYLLSESTNLLWFWVLSYFCFVMLNIYLEENKEKQLSKRDNLIVQLEKSLEEAKKKLLKLDYRGALRILDM
jgi:hypothetical protein